MKRVKLLIALLLTAATAFSALTGCNPSDPANEGITTQIVTDTEKNTEEITTAAETEPAFVGMIFDATARIVIPADADEIIRNAANLVTTAITEKAGMTLPVVSADQDGDTDSASLTVPLRPREPTLSRPRERVSAWRPRTPPRFTMPPRRCWMLG